MTQAYFLIPGLLVPEAARSAIRPDTLSLLDELTESLVDEPMEQRLAQQSLSGTPEDVWLWTVLTRQTCPPQRAPFVWAMDIGPQFSGEVWRMHLGHIDAEGLVSAIPELTDQEVETLSRRLRAVLKQCGFNLQRWDHIFYLTRQSPWGIHTRDWRTINGRHLQLGESVGIVDSGSDPKVRAERFESEFELLQNALAQPCPLRQDRQSINFLWISEGGVRKRFYPPTKIRSVMSNDTAHTGWAIASGILNHRVSALNETWPQDVAPGERIAVFDDLREASLRGNWQAWQDAVPGLLEKVRKLREASRSCGCERLLLIACGNEIARSFPCRISKPTGLLARLSRSRAVSAGAWLFEGNAQ